MGSPKKPLFYGWIVTLVSFLTVMISTATRQSLIIKIPWLLDEFGWSRAALSVVPALGGFTASFCTLFVGIISDRWDLKRLILIGASIACLGLVLSSLTSRLWHLYLCFGLLTSIGVSTLTVLPNTIIVSRWFHQRRGLAIGIVASGSGAGALVFMPLLQAVILTSSWRFGFLFLALVIGLVLIPLILTLQKTDPSHMGVAPYGSKGGGEASPKDGASGDSLPRNPRDTNAEPTPFGSRGVLLNLARSGRFWFAYLQFILGPLTTMPIIVHQAAFFVDKGYGSMTAALIVGVYGLGTFIGMLFSGFISDKLSRELSYSIGTVFLLLGCFFLLLVRPLSVSQQFAGEVGPVVAMGLPVLYGLFFGLGFGSRPSMDAATAADLFRGRHFGMIFGILGTGLGIGQLIGPVLSGMIFDSTGSYTGAIVFCIGGVLVATLCIWLAAPRRGNEYDAMLSRASTRA